MVRVARAVQNAAQLSASAGLGYAARVVGAPRTSSAERERRIVRTLGGLLLAWLFVLFSGGSSACAQERCGSRGAWVFVEFRAESWSEAARARVLADLAHTFGAQGIELCLQAQAKAGALASLSIDIGPESKASVEIEVRDAVTHKRVGREVDLGQIPPDGRELAVAIEADELLRASWAELALDTARARAAEPKPEVVDSVRSVLAPARVGRASAGFGARVAAEHYTGSVDLLGADAVSSLPLARALRLELSALARTGPARTSEHGSVRPFAFGAALGLSFTLAGNHAVRLDLAPSLRASLLEFHAAPAHGAVASSYANLLLVARLELALRVALWRALDGVVAVSFGDAVRGVRATDTGRSVSAASGVELGTSLGFTTR